MKKAKSGKRPSATRRAGALKTPGRKSNAPKAAPKTAAPKTVDEYLAAVPEPARSAMNKIRAAIRLVVPPEATEVISYKNSCRQAQESAGLVRFVCKSLQPVPHRRRDRAVQERTEGLLDIQRDHPLSARQAHAGGVD